MIKSLVISFCVAIVVMITFFSTDVFALNQSKTIGTTTISYQVGDVYIVTIPDNFFLSTSESYRDVIASNVFIPDGSILKVFLSTANYNGNYRVTAGRSSIPYSIKLNNVIQNSNSIEVLSVNPISDGNTKSSTLAFQTTTENINKASVSGLHTDTLTFTCSVI